MSITTEADKLISIPTQEHVLVLFVVLRALFDIKRFRGAVRRDARKWIEDTETAEPFSFRWCCEVLSDSPGVLQRQCIAFARNTRKPWPFLRFSGRREKSAA